MEEEQEMWEKKIIPNLADGRNDKNEKLSEKAILLERHQQVSDKTLVTLRYAAIFISWISVISALGLGVIATGIFLYGRFNVHHVEYHKRTKQLPIYPCLYFFGPELFLPFFIVFAWKNESQSLFSFGLDALLDSLSSMIILWRFYGNSIYSDEKERRACGVLGVLFLISFGSLAGKSIYAIVVHETMEGLILTGILATVNGVVCCILGFTKIYLGYKLESRALRTDSAITLTGAAMSFLSLISIEVYHLNENLWYLDDIFGLTCSLFFLGYGLWILWIVFREFRQAKSEKL